MKSVGSVLDLDFGLFLADISGQYKQAYNNLPLEFGIRNSMGIKRYLSMLHPSNLGKDWGFTTRCWYTGFEGYRLMLGKGQWIF